MYAHFKNALSDLELMLRAKIPAALISVRAFGSRVRGDHADESDFDVLVIVSERTVHTETVILDAVVEIEDSTGIEISVVIRDEESFNLEREHNTPFYENIMRDGVLA